VLVVLLVHKFVWWDTVSHDVFPHALGVFPHALAVMIMCVEVYEYAKINQIGKVLFARAEFLPAGAPNRYVGLGTCCPMYQAVLEVLLNPSMCVCVVCKCSLSGTYAD